MDKNARLSSSLVAIHLVVCLGYPNVEFTWPEDYLGHARVAQYHTKANYFV